MKFVNTTDRVVHIPIGKGGMTVQPKGYIEIEDGYAYPRRNDNGSRRPSVIENLAPQLEPADPADKAVWLQAPQPRNAKSVLMPSAEEFAALQDRLRALEAAASHKEDAKHVPMTGNKR